MNIIVTGASQGLGYEIVRNLSKNPENAILAISRNPERLKALQDDCQNHHHPGAVNAFPFNLAGQYPEDQLADGIRVYFKEVDILINNAGLLINKPFIELDEKDFDAMFNINVRSVFRLSRLLLPLFNRNAHILNISSMGGVQGSAKFPGLSLYSSSKGALAILTECMAEELKDLGIKVNCLALGAVRTEMLEKAFPGYKAPFSAGEMGSYIADFALHGHKYFNGKILPVSVSTP